MKYGIHNPALERLGRIVHSADTPDEEDDDPIRRGLCALSEGMSLCYPNGAENLTVQFHVFDALYTWCQLEVAKGKVLNDNASQHNARQRCAAPERELAC